MRASGDRRVDFRRTDFVRAHFEPAYLALAREGRIRERVDRALASLAACSCCPRDCSVDRRAGALGVCRTGRPAVVSSAFPHHGEEDGLRGRRGSGTLFFSRCNLGCVFCQNHDISQGGEGRECTAEEIAALMLHLQGLGCHNLNLVTPEHVVPQVIEALAQAIEGGLGIPVVYNTSAYDAPESLALLDGLVDIYMPDFKVWEPATAARLLRAKDYPEHARAAILEMHRQVGPLTFRPDGIACRGVLLRHLVMPGLVAESAAIFDWLAREVSPDTFVNVMGQYRPANLVGRRRPDGTTLFPEIDRRPTSAELSEALAAARRAGLWRFEPP
jgi:putative pyruvate formate lyase activating enzyme